jgi:hypothetical protein
MGSSWFRMHAFPVIRRTKLADCMKAVLPNLHRFHVLKVNADFTRSPCRFTFHKTFIYLNKTYFPICYHIKYQDPTFNSYSHVTNSYGRHVDIIGDKLREQKSPPPITEVRNVWSYTSTLPYFSVAWCCTNAGWSLVPWCKYQFYFCSHEHADCPARIEQSKGHSTADLTVSDCIIWDWMPFCTVLYNYRRTVNQTTTRCLWTDDVTESIVEHRPSVAKLAMILCV